MSEILIIGLSENEMHKTKKCFAINISGLKKVYHTDRISTVNQITEENNIGLVIIDFSLENKNCSNYCKQDFLGISIWLFKKHPEILQIILCTPADLVYLHQGLSDYNYEYLQKPVVPSILVSLVNKVLRRKSESLPNYHNEKKSRFLKKSSDFDIAVLPDMKNWKILLQANACERVEAEIFQFLNRLPEQFQHDRDYMLRLIEDLKQLFYSIMFEKNISAHESIKNDSKENLITMSLNNIGYLKNWISQIINFILAASNDIHITITTFGRAVDFIDKHIMEPMQRDTVAEYIGINPDYLSQIFRKELGIGISQYILKQKMEMAAHLLRKTNLSIGEIAESLGYCNLSYFSNKFKKTFSLTPGKYRSVSFKEKQITDIKQNNIGNSIKMTRIYSSMY